MVASMCIKVSLFQVGELVALQNTNNIVWLYVQYFSVHTQSDNIT